MAWLLLFLVGVSRLTANPAFAKEDRSLEGPEPAPYMCPVTLQEMNGAHSFIVLLSTGWVMAEKATKEVGIAGLQVISEPCCLKCLKWFIKTRAVVPFVIAFFSTRDVVFVLRSSAKVSYLFFFSSLGSFFCVGLRPPPSFYFPIKRKVPLSVLVLLLGSRCKMGSWCGVSTTLLKPRRALLNTTDASILHTSVFVGNRQSTDRSRKAISSDSLPPTRSAKR